MIAASFPVMFVLAFVLCAFIIALAVLVDEITDEREL